MPQKSFYARMGRLSAIVMILPASMAAGWLLGYLVVDRYLGIFPWGSILMILVGAGAGFYEIIQILLRDQGDDSRSKDY